MADDQYRRLSCTDCASPFSDLIGRRGRPRIRCVDCSIRPTYGPAPSVAVREQRVCINPSCGKEFTTRTARQQACSEKCQPGKRKTASRAVHELRRCANPDCAKPFTTRSAAQLVCSDKCRNRINNVRKQIAARDRSPRPCGWCKTVFEPAYGDLRSLYCANACKLKAQYSARGSCTHRRRAKAHGVEFKQINKWQVFARDKWRCQLCGVSTPRKYSGQIRDDAPQLDHIVPFAAGGAHVFENVQCACRRCNLRKMTRPMGQLHLALQ